MLHQIHVFSNLLEPALAHTSKLGLHICKVTFNSYLLRALSTPNLLQYSKYSLLVLLAKSMVIMFFFLGVLLIFSWKYTGPICVQFTTKWSFPMIIICSKILTTLFWLLFSFEVYMSAVSFGETVLHHLLLPYNRKGMGCGIDIHYVVVDEEDYLKSQEVTGSLLLIISCSFSPSLGTQFNLQLGSILVISTL